MNQKFIVAALLAFVANFLLGYLVWGILLMDTMTKYSNPACTATEMNMVWIAVAQLIWGLLTAYIFTKSNITSFSEGAKMGAIISILTGLGFDLMMYSTTSMMTSMNGIWINLVANAVVGGLIGGLVGWWLGRK